MAYWGEIPEVADTESGIAALEREQITKPRPMEVDGPMLHQPSSRHHPPTNEVLPSEYFQMDPVVIHSIRLLQYIRKVQAAIADLQSDVKPDIDSMSSGIGNIPEYDGPPIPDRSEKKFYTEEDYQSNFVKGIGKAPPPIDDVTCRRLLRRSTAALCAHLSFETTQESVLETLTDVCHEFLVQFTRHMAMAADRRAIHGNLGFPDIIERVFHDMGLGSVTDLHDFYQGRVLNYHKRLQNQSAQVLAEYKVLAKQPVKHSLSQGTDDDGDTLHVIRIKEEPSNDIQFPILDENDEVNEAEQLLNIESLGPFEITVEHETASGLTTEVDSKWSGRASVGEARSKSTTQEENTEVRTPQSNIPKTPQSVLAAMTPGPEGGAPTPRDYRPDDASIQEPGSISSMDIFSPSVPHTPSKVKKKK